MMAQPRRKFWGWGYEGETLAPDEIRWLEGAWAKRFRVRQFDWTPPPTADEIHLRSSRLSIPTSLLPICTADHYERLLHSYGASLNRHGYARRQKSRPALQPAAWAGPLWRPESRWFSRSPAPERGFPGCHACRRRGEGGRFARPFWPHAASCHRARWARLLPHATSPAFSIPAPAPPPAHPGAATACDRVNRSASATDALQTLGAAVPPVLDTTAPPLRCYYNCTATRSADR
jgi:hypothetical protein